MSDYMAPRTYTVQLCDHTNTEEFAAAILPKLADRTDWWDGLGLDWNGHPANLDLRFSVESIAVPGTVRAPGVDRCARAQIVVSFGDDHAGANWAAFGPSYFARISRIAFACGAGAISC